MLTDCNLLQKPICLGCLWFVYIEDKKMATAAGLETLVDRMQSLPFLDYIILLFESFVNCH